MFLISYSHLPPTSLTPPSSLSAMGERGDGREEEEVKESDRCFTEAVDTFLVIVHALVRCLPGEGKGRRGEGGE